MFKRWKKIDIALAALFILTNISYLFSSLRDSAFRLLLWLFIISAFLRILLIVKKKLFYKVRNRLIFSGLFLVATPLFFVTVFFYFLSNAIVAQYGMVILSNRMEERLNEIENMAELVLNMQRSKLLNTGRYRHYVPLPPNMAIFENNDGEYKHLFNKPEEFDFSNIKVQEVRGFFMVNNTLYFGLMKKNTSTAVILAFTVNQEFLETFEAVCDFQMCYSSPKASVMETSEEISSNPDLLKGGFIKMPTVYNYKYLDFSPQGNMRPLERKGNFIVFPDSDSMSKKMKEVNPTTLKMTILLLIVSLGPFLIASIVIGIRSIRVITRSINLITRGTQRIRNGDFSFRIKTKSGDQLQYLAESFNEMAAGIDRLLIDEKEKQRLEEELRIARSIQLRLLPANVFECEEFEVSAVNIPATEIAGDYFDYFYKRGEYLSMLVADVSGKGTSAAFYMAELKGVINHLQNKPISPAELVAECHDSLKDSFDRVTFITMNMAKFIIPERKFVFVRAGHTQAIFYNAEKKECIELYPNGMAIGLIKFSRDRMKEIEVDYNPGDILFLFSDGLSEIMNSSEEMLGVENLKRIITDNCMLGAEEIKKKILDFSIEYAEMEINMDDLTFILLKVK